MMFGWILIIVVIVLVVWYFSQGRTSWFGNGKQQQEDSPLEVLKKRFALGEISKEEYEELKDELQEEN